jgi:hypothetical protein
MCFFRETEKENAKMNKQSNMQQHDQDGDDSKQNKLPKAMVKPQAQILTHVIEGFVIQEASEPFPPVHKNGECDEPPSMCFMFVYISFTKNSNEIMCVSFNFRKEIGSC